MCSRSSRRPNPVAFSDVFFDDARVRKLTFTGSTEVGMKLYAKAATTMKRVSLELGGHAPFIIFDDADIPAAVRADDGDEVPQRRSDLRVRQSHLRARAHSLGVRRIRFADAVKGLRVGDPMSDTTQIGPLVDRQGLDKVAAHVDDAVQKGARALVGGHKRDGLYFDPTVLVDVKRGMRILEEETFGPVAPIVGFTDEAEAIRAANATPYGLAAYIWTRDLGRAFRVAEALDYGIVGVNDGLPGSAARTVWRSEEFRHRPRGRQVGTRRVSRREVHLDRTTVKFLNRHDHVIRARHGGARGNQA